MCVRVCESVRCAVPSFAMMETCIPFEINLKETKMANGIHPCAEI